MTRKLVNLHIIGVQKGGTSAIAHFLSQHPDICLVEGKEAHVFDQPDFLKQEDKQAFAQKRFWGKLKHYNDEKIICDATPITIFNSDFLRECIKYNPEAKVIVVLRNPVNRAVSHFTMMKSSHKEPETMLMAFLLEKKRLSATPTESKWDSGSPWRDFSYLSRGLYANQLQNVYRFVKPRNLLILNQEDLISNHKGVMKKVFSFLRLPFITVKKEIIFKSEKIDSHWTDWLAKLYAKAFFALQPGKAPTVSNKSNHID